MKKIMALWRGMPREMRTVLAMAGLASPFGLFYLLKRVLFPGWSNIKVLLVIFIVVLVISGVGWIVSRVFGLGGKRRSKKMAKDLAADADSGRVSMDHRAAIKANNDKFFNAINDMRKNLGISVYDLPWYIVIGDSGCGKTKLINEGGLTFSTGRPEGYQLGTLNYNWWFTEDAIFVDMAGRLCNPQDDGDRKEWGAFLDTIAKGRKGYPINGAIVCISADHLLQDPPEKIENDANVALERLRDLQSKLGVTFATYLVITKCDKVLGFMQFFDRAERDITIKNQIFGTSREGEFTQLYDPEKFTEDFDKLYGRLNDLRLRRLNDEADEIDLGLAYSFPEEFREFKEPLQTYVRTLFPMIKNPRAIKNLLFRGIYFTSATQEGELILKHLTERLGSEAASQFSPLDLYPNKRPHFIKDVLFKKVFPEHGLVFRNQEEALKNQKWAKLLWWGAGVAFVGLFGLVTLATIKFNGVIGKPKMHVVQDTKLTSPWEPKDAAKQATVLASDIKKLKSERFWAWVLSMGIGTDQPVNNIEVIRAALFEDKILTPALLSISDALRRDRSLGHPRDEEARAKAKVFQDALNQYVTWYGASGKSRLPGAIKYDGFKALCAIVDKESYPNSPIFNPDNDFYEEAKNYFDVVKDDEDWPNPAKRLARPDMKAEETVAASVGTLRNYLAGYATLDENHPDPTIAEWMRNQGRCITVLTSYEQMLGFPQQVTSEEVDKFRKRFMENYPLFAKAWTDIGWGLELKTRDIPDLFDAILNARNQWLDAKRGLMEAYTSGGGTESSPAAKTIDSLVSASEGSAFRGLDPTLWQNLQDARLTSRTFSPEHYAGLKAQTDGVVESFGYIIQLIDGGDKDDRLDETDQVVKVDGVLKQIYTILEGLDAGTGGQRSTPKEWIAKLQSYVYGSGDGGTTSSSKSISLPDMAGLNPVWKPELLASLVGFVSEEIERNLGTMLLRTMASRLQEVGPWGFAELYPDSEMRQQVDSAYRFPTEVFRPDASTPAGPAQPVEKTPETPAETPSRKPPSFGPPSGTPTERPPAPEPAAPPPPTPSVASSKYGKPACTGQIYLRERASEMAMLNFLLPQIEPGKHFSSNEPDLNRQCIQLVEDAGRKYMRQYVAEWSQAYKDLQLKELDKVLSDSSNWSSLGEKIRSGTVRATIGQEFETALNELLSSLVFWSYVFANNTWYDQMQSSDPGLFSVSQAVKSWMDDAVRSSWGSDSNPVAEARYPAGWNLQGRKAPWEEISGALVQDWTTLAQSIVLNVDLPREFGPATRQPQPISWGEISQLRQDAYLTSDGQISGKLVDFEHKARRYLSAELTNILVGLQNQRFGDLGPYDGWPYLNAGGQGASAMDTVEFQKFKEFLLEVERAASFFETLDAGVSGSGGGFTDPYRGPRESFVSLCQKWKAFLGLGPNLAVDDVAIDVEVLFPLPDPEIQDGAQNYYNFVSFDLGLINTGGDAGDQTLKVYTDVERGGGKQNAKHVTWRWQGGAGKELTFSLIDGITRQGGKQPYPDVTQTLGKSSPLAFVAYLHRYGQRDTSADRWVTRHYFDMKSELERKMQTDMARDVPANANKVGAKFYFTPSRSMPDPIGKLQPVTPGA